MCSYLDVVGGELAQELRITGWQSRTIFKRRTQMCARLFTHLNRP